MKKVLRNPFLSLNTLKNGKSWRHNNPWRDQLGSSLWTLKICGLINSWKDKKTNSRDRQILFWVICLMSSIKTSGWISEKDLKKSKLLMKQLWDSRLLITFLLKESTKRSLGCLWQLIFILKKMSPKKSKNCLISSLKSKSSNISVFLINLWT